MAELKINTTAQRKNPNPDEVSVPKLQNPPNETVSNALNSDSAKQAANTELTSTVSDIFDSKDILSKIDFDPVECINLLFPTEQSLSTIDKALGKLRLKMHLMDKEIRDLIRLQTDAGSTTIKEIEDIRSAIKELFLRVKGIKEKAYAAESMLVDVTQPIKSLDIAKRNLSLTSVFIERFQMLQVLTVLLKQNCEQKVYKTCKELLPAVKLLANYFEPFSNNVQVVQLTDSAKLLYLNLKRAIFNDFDVAFSVPGALETAIPSLNSACVVAELLEKELGLKTQLVQWYCDLQLREYRALFIQCAEESGLDQVARRYSWLKRILKSYDALDHSIFPDHWQVSLLVCSQFCDDTRRNLGDIIKKTGTAIDTKVLLQAFLITQEFESKLEKRFANVSLDSRKVFIRSITVALEPALSFYLEAENDVLLKTFVNYQTRVPLQDFDDNLMIMSSSADMFYAYRQLLLQVSRFSAGQAWLDLCAMMQRWLTVYAAILIDKFPIKDQLIAQQVNTSAILAVLQGGAPAAPSNLSARRRLTESEIKSVILIMNTAGYCYETTQQLVEKLREKAQSDYKSQINFDKELGLFKSVRDAGQRILQRATENAVEPCFLNMLKVLWGNMKYVGDTSDYVAGMGGVFNQIAVLVKSLAREDHWLNYFDYIHEAGQQIFVKFYNTMFRCRPLSEVGAEQMLLDLHSLRTAVVSTIQQQSPKASVAASTVCEFPGQTARTASAVLKDISKQIVSIEAVLKMVMKRLDPAEEFVMSFKHLFGGDLGVSGNFASSPKQEQLPGAINAIPSLNLFAAFNVGMLLRILDLKGARKPDSAGIVELFTQIYGKIPGALENNEPNLLSGSNNPVLNNLTSEIDDFSRSSTATNRHIKEPSINGEKFKRFMAMSVNGLKNGASALSSQQTNK